MEEECEGPLLEVARFGGESEDDALDNGDGEENRAGPGGFAAAQGDGSDESHSGVCCEDPGCAMIEGSAEAEIAGQADAGDGGDGGEEGGIKAGGALNNMGEECGGWGGEGGA